MFRRLAGWYKRLKIGNHIDLWGLVLIAISGIVVPVTIWLLSDSRSQEKLRIELKRLDVENKELREKLNKADGESREREAEELLKKHADTAIVQ